MHLILDGIRTSIEFYLLVLVSMCFLYNVNIQLRPDPSYVHQFESFEQLSNNLIYCNSHSGDRLNVSINSRLPECHDRALQSSATFEPEGWINYEHVRPGGTFKPDKCLSRQKVAIVIPYRDRAEQLEKFILYMHNFLPSQLIDYSIFVMEQTEAKPFNRAKLFNVGVTEILRIHNDTCCFIFHDVDLLPLDQRNLYMCSYRPRHLSSSVNTLRFNLLYPELFGGVIAVTKEQFESIGGFSNTFYGWGGEDDDIFERFRVAGYGIDRTPLDIGLYTMMRHPKMTPNPGR